ncbi:rabenosyn-5 isoform X2 [Daktulosphaira vitifoliae]|uniref:rabenosyn-5 isoform X2 n=1 Tax=Daktulosphaira vitifoliae TaxID=58002 RepID=UPI0021AAB43D|nr:rabenosyn-5 isoform X2 [Daktulosphaira vitifoliae]
MSEENTVLEGFLCPICKVDYGLDLKLFLHFQEAHGEDQDLVKSFKDLFGKAKEKIMKNDIIKKEERRNTWLPQDIGETRSHNNYFKICRNKWVEHFVMKTNKIIVRLEKLLSKLPTEPNKRKIHEQCVVQWLDGTDVKRCPECTRSFNITRRQHHCRLCGSIICNECSCFLPLSKAYEAINEVPNDYTMNLTISFRLCVHCGQVLENREQIKYRDQKPSICDYYEKIMECRSKIENDQLIKFYQIYNLLQEGDTSKLSEANIIRSNIVKLVETIDVIRETSESQLRNSQEFSPSNLKLNYNYPQQTLKKDTSRVTLEDGWSPITSSNINSENPMIEQMNIIKNYIKQAKEACRFDDVASLEKNLQELNEEYFRSQN